MPYIVVGLLGSALVAVNAAPQPNSGVATTNARGRVVASELDYALTLNDPFSPIGSRLPISEGPAAVDDALSFSNSPPPIIDLKAKAKALLRVRGIVKRGNTYVANVNGSIVRAGDEVGVTVEGQTVMFVIRDISLQRVQIEPR